MPKRLVSSEPQASSSRRGRDSRGPTPSSQRYGDVKLPPGQRTTGSPSSRQSSITSLRKPLRAPPPPYASGEPSSNTPPSMLPKNADSRKCP
ncbi:hypothetical protein [Kribbella sp. NPDC050459]|uniref:hypothetical protein n=1 Tax=Kribbella sp. NPDC050459 TaxID=3155785 RepID=UPI0033E4BA5D